MIPLLVILVVVMLSLFLFYASYSINSDVYIKVLCRAKTKDRLVALTFDDGPDEEQTARVLDILHEFDIKACFFCIGSKVETNTDILKRIVADGHLIGNHSNSHSHSFPLQSSKDIEVDLLSCENNLEQALGYKTNLFRPPFGVTNPMIAKAVKRLGYTTIGWSIRSLDTCMSAQKVWNRIEKQLSPGAIILLHDPLPNSDAILRGVLAILQKNGYRVERIDKLVDIK